MTNNQDKGPDQVIWHMRLNENPKNDIRQLVSSLGERRNMTLVEIGSYMGESVCLFAQSGKFDRIICVDPWMDIPGVDGNSYGGMRGVEAVFDKNASLYPQIVKFKGIVDDFVKSGVFDGVCGKIDIVYIDGMHTYEGCSHDIAVCKESIRPRVAYAGHDYTDKIAHVVGVKKAVDEAFGSPDAVFCDNSWIKFVK